MRWHAAIIVLLAMTGNVMAAETSEHEGDSEEHYPHHHIALFVGGATETNRDIVKKTELATGVEYELRLTHLLGVGGLAEFVGDELVREVVLMLPVSFHFHDNFRLVGAPGIEFTDHEDEFMFRVGLGYEFALQKGFTIAPEVNADFIESGKITYVYGFSVGKEF